MCFKKITSWFKPDPVIPPVDPPQTGVKKVALLFAIGSGYFGTENDLIGPPYDLANVQDFLRTNYPEFEIKTYQDTQVTRKSFENAIKAQFSVLKAGDKLLIYYSGHGTTGFDESEPDLQREGIYLTDGVYWDDEYTLVLQNIPAGVDLINILDSCFAHGSTTNKDIIVRKFVKTQEVPPAIKRKSMLKSDSMNYIVLAACQENQTSADLGTIGGAFTYYLLKAWNRSATYLDWITATAKLVSQNSNLDQIPNIEGDINLMNKQIFV